MPFALTTVGLLLIITGFQNTYKQFGNQVQGDFTGQNNFFYWAASLGMVGALGYAKGLESFSRAFMGLLLLVMILGAYSKDPHIFSDIAGGIATGSAKSANAIGAPLQGGGSGSGGGGDSGGVGDIIQGAGTIAEIASFL